MHSVKTSWHFLVYKNILCCFCLSSAILVVFLQTLANGNKWASAVEQALGNLLNAFIVTNHEDLITLRGCGKEANYNNLKIIIYDFSRPRFKIWKKNTYTISVYVLLWWMSFSYVERHGNCLCRLIIPRHMVPQTEHPTILSVLNSENHTVLNVLVDVVIIFTDFLSIY